MRIEGDFYLISFIFSLHPAWWRNSDKGEESQHGELNYPTVIDDHDVCGVCVCVNVERNRYISFNVTIPFPVAFTLRRNSFRLDS